MSAKGGITEGKSHAEGGIPMEVKSTGQQVELEGGEGVINKRNMASTKTFDFEGKKMTICEIASKINSADGNGVQINCDNVTGTKYKYAKGGNILSEDDEESFKEWIEDGNVIEFEKDVYSTQDAQYRNRLKGMDELRKYFRKEFLSDSYSQGGDIKQDLRMDYNFSSLLFPNERQFFLLNDTKIIQHRGMIIVTDGKREMIFNATNPISKLKKLGNASKSTKELYNKYFAEGGYVDLETYDYNDLIGKYVNIYSMGVELPTEHRIESVMFSSPQFRYRYLTLKFDLGIAPIKIEDIEDFLNNDIVYVKDTKEEFGIQFIPNQFAKGGRTKNAMKLDDYENASVSMDSYEDGAVSSNPTEFAQGGGVGNVYIALSKTKNGLLLSERFDKQITHQQLVDYYKKRGYEIIDSNIFKVTNKDVLDVYKDAISKFIEEKYNELVDWENTFLSYEIVGDRIIAQSCFVQTQNGKEYKITPNDLVNKKFAKGGEVENNFKVGDKVKFSVPYLDSQLDYKGTIIDFKNGYAVVEYENYKDILLETQLNPSRLTKIEFAKGGEVDLPKANKMFHLPLELAVYVPSTQDVDKVISESELKERVNEVSEYLARLFGGFTKSDKIGGFMSSKSELVTEDVVPVVSFATQSDFNANKNKLVNKLSDWAKRWGQEAIGFEFEGDLYYVPESFANGGGIKKIKYEDMTNQKHADGGEVDNEKVFEAQEDGIIGISSGSDAYTMDISKGDKFVTHGNQDNKYWWIVKMVDKRPRVMQQVNSFDYNENKSRVNVNTSDLILTFPRGDKGIYAEMKEVYAGGGGVDSIQEGDEVIWRGNKYLLTKIEKSTKGGFYDKKYYLSSNEVGISDAILDSLKDVKRHKYARGGGVHTPDYIDEKYMQFVKEFRNLRLQYGSDYKGIEILGFLAIDENDERLSDYEFEGEDFSPTKLMEVAKEYPQAKEIVFVVRLMGDNQYGLYDEGYSEIDDLAMTFDMARLNQYGKGGDVRDFEWYQMWKKDQVKKGTAHEMEHIDTIREFKKRGVSDKEVAQAIAKDHLEEDENYYIELEKMQESSAKVSNALQDFAHQKSKRKSSRKYNLGGLLGNDKPVNVHIILVEDYEAVVRSKDGTYVNDVNLKKDKVYKFGFLFDEGKDVAFDLGDGSDSFMLVPSNLIVVVGYDEEKMELGGEVKSYEDYKLDKNDKSILKLLLNINPRNATAEQRDKVSTFKGNNIVNDLSPKLIQKIYGILFQNHNVDNKILNLYITNIGVGNILMYAPSYLHKTMVGFDEKNEFVQVEKEIANIVTEGVRAFVFNEFELTDMDGFIHVYPQVNPKIDDLCSIFYKSKKKAVAVGVCEFTTKQKLDEFQRSIVVNQGALSLSQMISFAKSNDYLIVNEGITSEGDYTLIYTMTKY